MTLMDLNGEEIRAIWRFRFDRSKRMNLDDEEIREIVNDFENCGIHGGCESCKCYENLNSTRCNICDLLLTYKKDISDRITELIDKM